MLASLYPLSVVAIFFLGRLLYCLEPYPQQRKSYQKTKYQLINLNPAYRSVQKNYLSEKKDGCTRWNLDSRMPLNSCRPHFHPRHRSSTSSGNWAKYLIALLKLGHNYYMFRRPINLGRGQKGK
jgi:hypothetical protein